MTVEMVFAISLYPGSLTDIQQDLRSEPSQESRGHTGPLLGLVMIEKWYVTEQLC